MENIELVNTEERRTEQFPVGMRVLAVDDNPTCLRKLEELLLRCNYHVTKTMESKKALELLRDKSNMFDLVISDVEMPDADGFKLLEIGLEMDLPVIMLSSHGDYDSVMKGINHGACDYLVKPVGLKELKNIWQHVVKKNIAKNSNPSSESHLASRKRKEKISESGKEIESEKDEEDGDGSEEDGDESRAPKKARVVWSQDLHLKFVQAVQHLGFEKAVPKKILDYMSVDGLTRENVASHLQKYRLYLKKIAEGQQRNMGQNAFGTRQYPTSSLLSRSHPSAYSSIIPQGHHHQSTYHRTLSPNLFQRPLDPLQFPRSKSSSPFMGEFKSLGESALGGSLLDPRMSFVSTSTSMLQANYRQPLDTRNQSCLEGSSSLHGLSRFPSWQRDLTTTSALPGFTQEQAGNGLENCTPLVSTQLVGDFMNTTLDGQKWEQQNSTMMNNTFGNVDYPLPPPDNMVFGDNDDTRGKGLDESLITPIDDSATLNNQAYVLQPTMLDPEMNTDKPDQNDVFADIMNEMLNQDENNGMPSMAARFGLDSFPPQ